MRPLDIVVLGLSLSSSWGNGHATTYRALLRGLATLGHRVLFLERDMPWYASHRDLADPEFCHLAFYDDLDQLGADHHTRLRRADAVIVGSYVPEGIAVLDHVLDTAAGTVAFYDIDTPVTLASIVRGDCAYLDAGQIPRLDLYLSFTGGAILDVLRQTWGAKAAHALYCAVDETRYRPMHAKPCWDLGYLGTYSARRHSIACSSSPRDDFRTGALRSRARNTRTIASGRTTSNGSITSLPPITPPSTTPSATP